jgi:hypothetical protein
MKKNNLLLLVLVLLVSCTKDTQRVEMKCYVYDSISKTPIENVEVIQLLDGEHVVVAMSSTKGYFEVSKQTKLSLGMEFHNLANLILLKKQNYLTDTIEVYGNSNDLYKKDSIFMKKSK